jgi:tetratricopeptide (TPR) repeat protein
VPLSDRIEEWRDRLHGAGTALARRFLPDLSPPVDRGGHKAATAILERGRKAYNAKNYPRAEELFRQSVLEDERYAKAHYYLGLVLYKLNDAQAALRAWKRASEVDPGGPMGLKSERKIKYVKGHVDRTVNELKDRLRR